jgi:hypothetical protein
VIQILKYGVIATFVLAIFALFVAQIIDSAECRERGGVPVRPLMGVGVDCVQGQR